MSEVSVFEAIEIAWRRKFLIAALVLVATLSAYLISAMQPSVYQADTTLVFPGARPNLPIPGLDALAQAFGGRLPTLQGGLDVVPSSTTVLVPLLKSRALSARVIRTCNLMREYETGSLQAAADLLKQNTSISQDPSGTVVIAVKAKKKPRLAADIANAYVRELRQMAKANIDLSMLRRYQTTVKGQLAIATRNLRKAEEEVRQYQEIHRIVALPDQARMAVDHAAALERDLNATHADLAAIEARLSEVRRQIVAQTSQPLEALPAHSPVIQNWRTELVKLNSQLVLARQEFTDGDPKVQSLQAQIAETKHQLRLELQRVQGSLKSGLAPELTQDEVNQIAYQARTEALDRELKRVESASERLPVEMLQLARLERERGVQEALYANLRSQREKLRLVEAQQAPAFVVLDAAEAPEGRISPRPKLIAILAAILSFVVALTLAFFVEYAERARYARGKRSYLATEELQPPAHVTNRP